LTYESACGYNTDMPFKSKAALAAYKRQYYKDNKATCDARVTAWKRMCAAARRERKARGVA